MPCHLVVALLIFGVGGAWDPETAKVLGCALCNGPLAYAWHKLMCKTLETHSCGPQWSNWLYDGRARLYGFPEILAHAQIRQRLAGKGWLEATRKNYTEERNYWTQLYRAGEGRVSR